MQNGIHNRRGAETRSFNKLSGRIIGSCTEIHRALGPGLLESAHEECLGHDLSLAGISFERQKSLPVAYKDVKLDCGYRMDVAVENKIMVELKSVGGLLPLHEAQLLACLKLSGLELGLLINFKVTLLKHGIKRMVNNFIDSASPRLSGEIQFG